MNFIKLFRLFLFNVKCIRFIIASTKLTGEHITLLYRHVLLNVIHYCDYNNYLFFLDIS
jgi:hypothetical protein